MKLNFTRALIALAVVTLSYSACQKSGTKPATATKTATPVNVDALAVSMATNFYKSMTGGFGGSNIGNGMQAPSAMVKNNNKFQLDAVSSLCGYVIDSTYSNTTNVNDTTNWVSTKFIFVYKCLLGSKVNGYSCYDSVFTQSYNNSFVNTVDDIQNYNVIASDGTFTKFLCDGTIFCNNSESTNATANAPQVYHAIACDYKLLAVAVDVTAGVPDIVAGFCTYVTSTHDIDATTGASGLIMNYKGSITFLGNHLARLIIDPNHVYTINVLTGAIISHN